MTKRLVRAVLLALVLVGGGLSLSACERALDKAGDAAEAVGNKARDIVD